MAAPHILVPARGSESSHRAWGSGCGASSFTQIMIPAPCTSPTRSPRTEIGHRSEIGCGATAQIALVPGQARWGVRRGQNSMARMLMLVVLVPLLLLHGVVGAEEGLAQVGVGSFSCRLARSIGYLNPRVKWTFSARKHITDVCPPSWGGIEGECLSKQVKCGPFQPQNLHAVHTRTPQDREPRGWYST